MQPTNRIKLNRSAFRLDSNSVPRRRRGRSACGHNDPLTPYSALADRDDALQQPAAVRGSSGEEETGYDKGISSSGVWFQDPLTRSRSAVVDERPATPSRLQFAWRFGDGKHARHDQTGPGTTECYGNGKVCVESGPSGQTGECQSAPRPESEPRRRRGRPRKIPRPASERVGQSQTREAGAPNFSEKTEQKTCFNLVTSSGRCTKRCVKKSFCALCGEIKYTAPASKEPSCVRKPRLRCPGRPRRQKRARGRPAAQPQRKASLIWYRKHPKVKLCDIARVFDMTSCDSLCVMPVVLHRRREHRRVQCFKKEYMSLMHLCPRGNGKWVASQICKVCAPTNSCASLSSGEQVSGGTGGEQVSDIVVGHEGCDGTLDNHNAWILDHQRMTLTSDDGTTGNGAEGSAVPTTIQGNPTTRERHVPPLVLFPVCNDLGYPKRQLVVDHSTPAVFDKCRKENGQSDNSEGEVCSLLSFSCQRTQPYVGWTRFSCARTYKSWPFPRRGPPSEFKSSVHTGPRWILSITASDVAEQGISSMQTSLHMNPECTTENNVRKSLYKSHESVVAQNEQGRTSATQSKMEPDPAEVGKTPEDPAECQKNPSQASESVHKGAQPLDHSLIVPEPSAVKESVLFPECGAPCLANSSAKAGETCSPEASSGESSLFGFHFNKQHNSPAERKLRSSLVSVAGIKTTELRSPPNVQTQNFSLGLEGSKKSAAFTTSQGPCQDIGLIQRTLQTSPVMRHPGEETHNTTSLSSSSKMVRPKVYHQATASMIVHHRDEQSSNTVVNRAVLLCPKTTDPASSPPTSNKGRRWKKHFNSLASHDNSSSTSSSSGEDISSLSFGEDSEQLDAECPLLQEDMCELSKANQGSPPFRSAECSVVAGTDLDVLRAYEQDAIVLDVIQDDPDLFGSVSMETAGNQTQKPSTVTEKGKQVCLLPEKSWLRNRHRIVWGLESTSSRPALLASDAIQGYSPEDHCTVETNGKARDAMNQLISSRSLLPLNPIAKPEQTATDYNYNLDKRCIDVNFNNIISSTGSSPIVINTRSSVRTTTRINTSLPRSLMSSYCWYYFSERYTCPRTVCWFLHLPRDDDEKFCMEIVQKFCRAGNPLIVQRAVEVFVGYYATNAPGVSFSPYVVNTLLSSLLSLALLIDLISVINTLLMHKKMPPPEFVVALYKLVRERGLIMSVPDLILLTSKIIETGCVFTVSQCDLMQSQLQMLQVPIQQMRVFHAVKCRALATNPHTAEVSLLAEAEVRVKICKQQESWAELASVFCSVCAGRYSAEEISRFCCCVIMALLKKSKDILTIPYEPFAESVCQEVPSDELVKSFLGRVGISLLFKYHRIQEWTKGVRLVKTMSRLHVEFSKLKGLFPGEDGMSRCQLITVAAEIFLNSRSIEGALNVFREHEWFVSSNTWPCEPADVENRRRVLALLAGKTSHRDTLEVLSNLPGLRQLLDGVQVGEYSSVFNAHLQKCITNQVLPVAADTLEFMLTQGIQADTSLLQTIIQKLGKQNFWNRARTLFKCARSGGYYTQVLCEKDSLAVPCSLKEVELILAVEMFITFVGTSLQNPAAPSQPLLITLKRDCGGKAVEESVYLAASCRMLSVAQIPNPRLNIRYIAVNQNREQFFHLDRSSAAKWLSHNHKWAQEMWAS